MGNNNRITTVPGKPIDNPLAKNIVDLCPVGALLDEDFLFKARVWNLTPMPSIDPTDALGANTYLDVKDNEVQRTRPRGKDGVNGFFISDASRATYKVLRDSERLENPVRRENGELVEIDVDDAVSTVGEKLSAAAGSSAVLVSTHATIEEMNAAKDLAEALGTDKVGFVPNEHVEDRQEFPGGFVIEGDKSPNTAGAKNLLGKSLDDLGIDESTAVVLVVNPSTDRGNISEDHLATIRRAAFVAAVDVLASPLANSADLALAGRMWAEKSGTFVNSLGAEQSFAAAVVGPGGTRDEVETLRALIDFVGAATEATGATA